MGAKPVVSCRSAVRPIMLAVAFALLLPATSAEATFPGLNSRIAYSANGPGNFEIYTMESNGTGHWRLTYDASSADYCPSWSADGRKIAWEKDSSIWIMNFDGSNQQMVSAHGNCPVWSPDGSQVAFSRPDTGSPGIWIVNSDGSGEHEAPPGGQFRAGAPSWSPNGQKIAYHAEEFDGLRIFVMNPSGTGRTKITQPIPDAFIDDCCPDWAPNGSKIVFYGALGIETVNPDGTGRTLITDQLVGIPHWSPDGTKIVTSASDGNDSEIYTMSADGSNQVNVTNNSFSDSGPSWGRYPETPPYGHARPKSATPLTIKLVPAYEACTSPNGSHGAPLALPSCNPPQQSSGYLTVGTGDGGPYAPNSTGTLTMKAIGESPISRGNGDQSDVPITISITDVRCRMVSDVCGDAGSDYGGGLRAAFALRLTDRYSGSGGVYPATSVDTNFGFPFYCSPTPNPSIGSTCAITTSADAVTPGIAIEGRRAIWQMGQVQVYDSGADGDVTGTSTDDTLFLTQGLFAP